ncbi:MAG: hypothetical protein BIFFINMI_01434 [Phycisphaerae bacterium]|nr:hypothetical protein [Phycisphaerae bacterium]
MRLHHPIIRAALGLAVLTVVPLLASCDMTPPQRPLSDYIGRALTRPRADLPAAPRVVAPGPAPAAPQASPTTQPAAAPLKVTVEQAILLALANNRELSVRRLNPAVLGTFEQQERAVFDPDVTAELTHARDRSPDANGKHDETVETVATAGVSQHLPTGTDVSAGLTVGLLDDQYRTRLGLSVNQALLRGAGLDVNLAAIRQARLDTLASQYELRGFAEAVVAQTEEAYWDYALARRTIEIVSDSLKLAEQQLREVKIRIDVGKLAETELAAAQAEVALRNEDLINARSVEATARLRLLRLTSPAGADIFDRDVTLLTPPAQPRIGLDDVRTYVQVALRMRPDLNQARLGVQRGDLELVKTRNGLLPRLDLFIALGKSGYSDSFGHAAGNFGSQDYDLLAGARFEYPPQNRDARARHQRAIFTREQAERAVDNLAQLVQVDVRSAYIEVGRAREQVTATAATRHLQEEVLRAETQKAGVGKSTSFLVAQAQRDLLDSQIQEVRAVVSYLKALIELHLQEGALLERRGIEAPGADPVTLAPAPPAGGN